MRQPLGVRPHTLNEPVGGGSQGNRLTLYVDGDESFQVAYEAICRAQQRVWLEMYILEPDAVGRMAIDALADAARRGCDVILLFDRFGSPRLRARHAAPIWKAGGRVALYNPFLPWRKMGRKIAPFSHRDHRKILIVDDVGFCGGRNISVEYGGPGPERFYDLTVRLEGPCVRDLATVFRDSLYRATRKVPPLPPASPPFPDGIFVDVLELSARTHERDLDRAIYRMIDQTRRHCYISTPYFIPPAWLRHALIKAGHRGVDVRVLTAGASDVPHARTAGRHVYGGLLAGGGRIYEMQHPILHAKYLTIDGRHSIIGSYNVDQYGGKHNLEVGVATRDPSLARMLEAEFFSNLDHSVEITPAAWKARPWATRLLQWFLFQLSRI
ncbi:MAG: phosphatidylserine/phosphatidylglycerophosphate/cardiolipin synthase family protein [Rhodothermales bacterium]